MPSDCTHIPYRDTHSFSKLVIDYLSDDKKLNPFFEYATDIKGIEKAIIERKKFPVNRDLLVKVLKQQYTGLQTCVLTEKNIASLHDENTFTICTAHQPNLFTGYLYFVYKILHAVKLAQELSKTFPDKHFVPVYYMGSEDNDLDELGTFRYNNEKYIWNANGQTGAVGRMNTDSLKPVLENLFRKLGPPGAYTEQLKELLQKAYGEQKTIGKATQYLVNELFGKYGLVVLDPDDAELKASFMEVMKDDLLHQEAKNIVSVQNEKLAAHYKTQAYPRPVNLFYLKDQLRERIEKDDKVWKVLNTDIVFDKKTLLEELENHPERFSPNVVLRGLFQETILPDIAFVGGGAEVAYWLQLKELFRHYQVFYPVIFLRQSVLWINADAAKRMTAAHLSLKELFLDKNELIGTYLLKQGKDVLNIEGEAHELEVILKHLKSKAVSIDPTLEYSAEAVLKKINYQLDILRKKMLRAEKKKHAAEVARIERLKAQLFPNGALQERVENFMEYYTDLGISFFDRILNELQPLQKEFLIYTEEK